MKKFYLLSVAIATVFLLSAAMDNNDSINKKASVNFMVSPEPYLPSVPYDYRINFPSYLYDASFWLQQNVPHINQNITDHGATLGRVLFYDKRLSANNEIACGSCHKQEHAFADDQALSEGIGGTISTRNSPNLNDLVWKFSYHPIGKPLFWDAREDNLIDMVLLPIVHEGEMGKDLDFLPSKLAAVEFYPPLFEAAFGDSEITKERIGDALAQFVWSMSSFDSKYDMVQMGQAEFTPAEQMGLELFNSNCNICHTAPQFGIIQPTINGMASDDIGFGAVTGNASDNGKFRNPSLRNIALSAPYMHDGRFQTLEEVAVFYSDSIPDTIGSYVNTTANGFPIFVNLSLIELNPFEIGNLTAFLKTLTSENLAAHPKWSDPFLAVNTSNILPLEEKVSIYPNPFSERTTIAIENPKGEDFILRLTTNDGRILKTITTNKGTVYLEKGNYSAGVYFLEIIKGKRKKIDQIVIQ